LFFAELLPEFDHLGELKVTLHVFWLLAQQKGDRPYVAWDELASDARLTAGLAVTGRPPEEVLDDALERAVARGTLLRAFSPNREWYFVNSERGRQAVEEVLAGQWSPAPTGEAVEVQVQRPNIFALYEQNVGPLTPLLAEELKEAETSYPASWIEDAFREAVELNKRSWRYIQRILERWATEGRGDETARRSREGDPRRFIEGKYADYIEY
ncbi:MAG TPA: DnaD domain protein, partial [Anaerolineae bacterium]|nr:DnaD domain protein [Anaerolineae bacterium]